MSRISAAFPEPFERMVQMYKSWNLEEQKSFKHDLWRFMVADGMIKYKYCPKKWMRLIGRISDLSGVPRLQVTAQIFANLTAMLPKVVEKWECELNGLQNSGIACMLEKPPKMN